jgi:hypothetical protein
MNEEKMCSISFHAISITQKLHLPGGIGPKTPFEIPKLLLVESCHLAPLRPMGVGLEQYFPILLILYCQFHLAVWVSCQFD